MSVVGSESAWFIQMDLSVVRDKIPYYRQWDVSVVDNGARVECFYCRQSEVHCVTEVSCVSCSVLYVSGNGMCLV